METVIENTPGVILNTGFRVNGFDTGEMEIFLHFVPNLLDTFSWSSKQADQSQHLELLG